MNLELRPIIIFSLFTKILILRIKVFLEYLQCLRTNSKNKEIDISNYATGFFTHLLHSIGNYQPEKCNIPRKWSRKF